MAVSAPARIGAEESCANHVTVICVILISCIIEAGLTCLGILNSHKWVKAIAMILGVSLAVIILVAIVDFVFAGQTEESMEKEIEEELQGCAQSRSNA